MQIWPHAHNTFFVYVHTIVQMFGEINKLILLFRIELNQLIKTESKDIYNVLKDYK